MTELKTKLDYINYLKEHGITKLPKGWSIQDAVDAIKGKEIASNRFDELMDSQLPVQATPRL